MTKPGHSTFSGLGGLWLRRGVKGDSEAVYIVCFGLSGLSSLFRSLNQTNQTNQTDQMNQMDQLPATRREMVLGTYSFL